MSDTKYLAVPKGAPMLPKEATIQILWEWHNSFYDLSPVDTEYDKGVAEGFKRMIRFIGQLEFKPVEWPESVETDPSKSA